MPENANLIGRNGNIWRDYYRGGLTQAKLADKYGLSQERISQIIREVRDSIKLEDRDDLIKRELELFEELRGEVLKLWYETRGMPVTAGKDGDIVRDPKTNEVVRDESGRLNAVRLGLQITERMHKMLNLDATKQDSGATEAAAAAVAAAEALARLHGQASE